MRNATPDWAPQLLLIVGHQLRCSFARFKLGTHLLETGSESVANIPILLGFALYTELALRFGHYTSAFPAKTLTGVVFLGIVGPGLALFAFHPAFGLAYFAGMIAAMLVITIRMQRFKIDKHSN